MEKVTGIVLAAGNSTRYGRSTNKNFELINGMAVLAYTLDVFDRNGAIDDIIVVGKKDEFGIIEDIISRRGIGKKVLIVEGGNSRQESVCNALEKTDSGIVVIHDGARPMIKDRYINDCLACMKDYYGATVGVKSKDTIKISDDNGIVINSTKRSNTWIIQTPQCFNRELLLFLHQIHRHDEVTDDCMLLELGGYDVKIVEGDYTNIKVTTLEDLDIVKGFCKVKK